MHLVSKSFNKPALLLASQSPRRVELLGSLGLPFDVRTPDIDETFREGESVEVYSKRVAFGKYQAIESQPGTDKYAAIISADTIVHREGIRYGKPRDANDAWRILDALRGKTHTVTTSVVAGVKNSQNRFCLSTSCSTDVIMRELTDDEIRAYIDSGDPFGKAGAYAIQNAQFHLVEAYDGCFAAVVGLALCHLVTLLHQINGLDGLNPVPVTYPYFKQGLCRMSFPAFIEQIQVQRHG